jgi:TetR/AcrR family transcriptional regulator, transcriptional repressor for nem operon
MRTNPNKLAATRNAILRSARILFDRHGFQAVSIDAIMGGAGLTRGGFYKYFNTKGELFAEVVKLALADYACGTHQHEHSDHDDLGKHILSVYLSPEHKKNAEACPMIVLPSDTAEAGEDVKTAFQSVLELMISGLSHAQRGQHLSRKHALATATLCMGGMVLARAVENQELADELRSAALDLALQLRRSDPVREANPG